VFNYPPFISEELRNLVVLTNDNNKLENKINRIMKCIGVEKDNEEEQGSEEEHDVGLKQQMDKHAQDMNKLNQQMEKIMELLLKRN
jgi:predicted Rossmann fold nucleotide-binding protein DprA/Smf involved in DNA uptake